MSGLLAVAGRELIEKRNVFAAAAVAAVLPLAAPLLPSVSRMPAAEVREIAAAVVALAFALGLATVLGATMIGRDLSERRFGFYLARPLSATAIWGGKLVAGVLLATGVAVVAALPVLLVGGARVLQEAWQTLPWLVGGALLVLVVSHAVSIAVRSRSAWIILDIVTLAVAAALGWSALSALLAARASDAASWAAGALAVAALLAFAAAGLVQVARGRTDLERGHRGLAITLAIALVASTLAVRAWAAWVLSPAPADLAGAWVTPAPAGDWAALHGRARHRGDLFATFLLDPATGRVIRLGVIESPIAFSADGRHAAWLASDGAVRGSNRRSKLVVADLNTPVAVRATGITCDRVYLRIALSPDGTRVAVRDSLSVSVFDVVSDRLLVAVRRDNDWDGPMVFVSDERLRVYDPLRWENASSPGDAAIRELDVPTRSVVTTGRLVGLGNPYLLLGRNPATDRVLFETRDAGGRRLVLARGGSGGDATTIARSGQEELNDAAFLADGRIAVVEAHAGQGTLRVLAGDASEVARIDLAAAMRAAGVGARRLVLCGESAPGRVLVGVTGEGSAWRRGAALEVDLAASSVRVVASDLVPVGFLSWPAGNLEGPRVPGSVATRLFYARDGALVLLDPATGSRRTLVPGSGRDDS